MPEKFRTICGNCVFANGKYIESNDNTYFKQEKNISKACSIGALEKNSKNYTIKYIENDSENNSNFYALENCVCVFYRPPKWAKDKKDEDLIKIAKEEVTLKTSLIVYFAEHNTIEELRETLKSIEKSELKPANVHIVINGSKEKLSDLTKCAEDYCITNWTINTIIGEKSMEEALDIVVKNKVKDIFIMFCFCGYNIPKLYLKTINMIMNDDMKRICIVMPKNHFDGLFMSSVLYKMLGGNKNKYILDSINDLLDKEEENKKFVITHKEIEESYETRCIR